MIYLLALAMGLVAGLRTMMAPAAVSWAAHLGILQLNGTLLAFFGKSWALWLFTAWAVFELILDQTPKMSSRTVPWQFAVRLLSGALTGMACGLQEGRALPAAIAGLVGAVMGTLGGRSFRMRLASAFGRDRPAALIEDTVAVVGASLLVVALR
jgi:uncharacterized membrane protein